MMTYLKTLGTSYELIWAWTIRIIKARYQQSVLGGIWAILQPTATVIIFSIIFTFFIPVNTGGIPYVIFSYVAMVPWTLFSSSVTDMVDSLVGNMNLVTKIYFPREILPIAALFARVFDFLIAFLVVIILIILYRVPVFVQGWLLLPLILIVQMAIALGLGFFGAALNIFYRDLRHIYALGLSLWFYASPILYPVTSVPEKVRSIYFINPMAGVIEGYRAVILRQTLPDQTLLISTAVAFIFLVAGYLFFKRVEPQFADVV